MAKISTLLFIVVTVSWLTTTSDAADCYEITGWDSTDYVGAQALLQATSCTVTPLGTAWLYIDLSYGTPPNDDLYLRIATSDSHMSGGTFTPLLIYSHIDSGGLPVVKTDAIVGPSPNTMQSTVNSPSQGPIVNKAKARLRHRNTGKCLVSQGSNGAKVRNFACADDPAQIYVLDHVVAGQYRLRHETTNQCLYTLQSNGAFVYNWVCWNDPNMRFKLVASQGGYRLQHVQNSQCIYGSTSNGGFVHSWGCWGDPNMVYQVDVVELPQVQELQQDRKTATP